MAKNLQYTINLDADLGNLESKFNSVKDMMTRLTSGGKHPEISKVFDTIGKSLDSLRTKAS
jgi:hypothetical protein